MNRILKMHAVMPRMLRKVTEPGKSFANDHAIDVDKRVQEVLNNWKREQQEKKRARKTRAMEAGRGSLHSLNETAR